MLVLSRKKNESIIIDDKILVKIVEIKPDKVKIAIEAPKEIKIYRHEIYKAIQQENIRASRITQEQLRMLERLI